MSRRSISLTDQTYDYLLEVSLREHPVLRELREVTGRLEEANMQIAPEQGQFMAFLVRAVGAVRALEVGAFTGYSALSVALALPEDGLLIACDVSEEWTSIAKRYWEKAGVQDRIDLRIAPAANTLESLIASGEAGTFDFAFIDADKVTYARYYELCLKLLRAGGIIVVDNVLRDGRVADSTVDDAATLAVRDFNRMVRGDERVDLSMIPVGDGLTLARKRVGSSASM